MTDVWAQVCGPLVLRLGGTRREGDLPGRQGRQIAAYLVANRSRQITRDELIDALWGDALPPEGAEGTLSTLLSRVRRVLGAELLTGTRELRLRLPPDAWVDLEVAERAIHIAESAAAQGEWKKAWAPARIALHTAQRGFFRESEAPWAEERRAHVENLRLRALEVVTMSGLALGGPELPAAERSARALVAAAPFRETGHRLLMEYFAARGDAAEALRVYDRLRVMLREEMGIAPSARLQEMHGRLVSDRTELTSTDVGG